MHFEREKKRINVTKNLILADVIWMWQKLVDLVPLISVLAFMFYFSFFGCFRCVARLFFLRYLFFLSSNRWKEAAKKKSTKQEKSDNKWTDNSSFLPFHLSIEQTKRTWNHFILQSSSENSQKVPTEIKAKKIRKTQNEITFNVVQFARDKNANKINRSKNWTRSECVIETSE